MADISVGSEDGDFIAKFLETKGSIDDETLCPTDSEVGVEKHDVFWSNGHVWV